MTWLFNFSSQGYQLSTFYQIQNSCNTIWEFETLKWMPDSRAARLSEAWSLLTFTLYHHLLLFKVDTDCSQTRFFPPMFLWTEYTKVILSGNAVNWQSWNICLSTGQKYGSQTAQFVFRLYCPQLAALLPWGGIKAKLWNFSETYWSARFSPLVKANLTWLN